ncbi:MAG: DUF2610 domain-containing protein, partial [Phycisphaerales bacterium]
ARSLLELGRSLFTSDLTGRAVGPAQESVKIFEELYATDPEGEGVASGLCAALSLLDRTADKAGSVTVYRRIRTILEPRHGRAGEGVEATIELARALNAEMVFLNDEESRAAPALAQFESALRLATAALESQPTSTEALRLASRVVRNSSWSYRTSARPDPAAVETDKGLAIARAFIARNPFTFAGKEVLADLLQERARVETARGDTETARRFWSECAETHRGLWEQSGERPAALVEWCDAKHRLYELWLADGRPTEAREELQELLDRVPRALTAGNSAPETLRLLLQAAVRCSDDEPETAQGRERAVGFCRRALAEVERLGTNTAAITPEVVNEAVMLSSSMAKRLIKLGRHSEAVKACEGPIGMGGALKDPDHRREWASLMTTQAESLVATGRIDLALERLRSAVTHFDQLIAERSYDYYARVNEKNALAQLSRVLAGKGDLAGEATAAGACLALKTYLDGPVYAPAIAATATPTEENAGLWRAAIARAGPLKQFTIPMDFNGLRYPTRIYVSDTLAPLEDQLRWFEESRAGKIDPSVHNSFRSLAKVATESGISLAELCVFSLSTQRDWPPAVTFNGLLAEFSARATADPGNKVLREAIAFSRVNLAAQSYYAGKPDAARQVLAELEGPVTDGREPIDPSFGLNGQILLALVGLGDRDPTEGARSGMALVQTWREGEVRPDANLLVQLLYGLGEEAERAGRLVEAVGWHAQALAQGNSGSAVAIHRLLRADSSMCAALPAGLARLWLKPGTHQADVDEFRHRLGEHLRAGWSTGEPSPATGQALLLDELDLRAAAIDVIASQERKASTAQDWATLRDFALRFEQWTRVVDFAEKAFMVQLGTAPDVENVAAELHARFLLGDFAGVLQAYDDAVEGGWSDTAHSTTLGFKTRVACTIRAMAQLAVGRDPSATHRQLAIKSRDIGPPLWTWPSLRRAIGGLPGLEPETRRAMLDMVEEARPYAEAPIVTHRGSGQWRTIRLVRQEAPAGGSATYWLVASRPDATEFVTRRAMRGQLEVSPLSDRTIGEVLLRTTARRPSVDDAMNALAMYRVDRLEIEGYFAALRE